MRLLFLFLSSIYLTFLSAEANETLDEEIERVIASLSLEQKAGQLFISFFHGSYLDEETKQFIANTHLGNFLYFSWANELAHPQQVKKLSEELFAFVSKTNGIPPLICIDQEGGVISRLTQGYTLFPGNMALGATRNPLLAEKVGSAIAHELRCSGIHLNLAPVVDINSNLHNPIIGVRSFAHDPNLVAFLAEKMILGFHKEKIGVTLKHFPGHGDTSLDSHTSLPAVYKTLQELQTNELYPFFSLKNEADCILTAHVNYPSLDPHFPATLSSKILTNLLRDTMGYQGVVISDSLMMRGVSPDQSSLSACIASISKAAIRAFQAGCDLMIISKAEWADFSPTRKEDEYIIGQAVAHFAQAIKEGIISQERLHASLKRILRLKAKYAHNPSSCKTPVKLEDFAHESLAYAVGKESLTLLSPEKRLWDRIDTRLSGNNWSLIAPKEIKSFLEKSLLEMQLSPTLLYFTREDLKDFPTLCQKAKKLIDSSSLTLFLSFNAHLCNEQKQLITFLSQKCSPKQLIFASLRNPQDLLEAKDHLTIATYSPSPASIAALFHALDCREKPTGILPLSVSQSEH